jgi:hypothetical protein
VIAVGTRLGPYEILSPLGEGWTKNGQADAIYTFKGALKK